MTKRARPHFRVAEFESGQPWIVFEQFDGDEMHIFKYTLGFDLPPGTTLERAEEIRNFLSDNLIRVNETP
jgi:hypothetical protein